MRPYARDEHLSMRAQVVRAGQLLGTVDVRQALDGLRVAGRELLLQALDDRAKLGLGAVPDARDLERVGPGRRDHAEVRRSRQVAKVGKGKERVGRLVDGGRLVVVRVGDGPRRAVVRLQVVRRHDGEIGRVAVERPEQVRVRIASQVRARRPVREDEVVRDDLVTRESPHPTREPEPSVARMSPDPDRLTHAGRDRPALLVEREVDVAESVPGADRRDAGRVDGDVPEVAEVDNEGAVGSTEAEGGVRVAATAGGDADVGAGGAGQGLGDLVLRGGEEDRGRLRFDPLVVSGCARCLGASAQVWIGSGELSAGREPRETSSRRAQPDVPESLAQSAELVVTGESPAEYKQSTKALLLFERARRWGRATDWEARESKASAAPAKMGNAQRRDRPIRVSVGISCSAASLQREKARERAKPGNPRTQLEEMTHFHHSKSPR